MFVAIEVRENIMVPFAVMDVLVSSKEVLESVRVTHVLVSVRSGHFQCENSLKFSIK